MRVESHRAGPSVTGSLHVAEGLRGSPTPPQVSESLSFPTLDSILWLARAALRLAVCLPRPARAVSVFWLLQMPLRTQVCKYLSP